MKKYFFLLLVFVFLTLPAGAFYEGAKSFYETGLIYYRQGEYERAIFPLNMAIQGSKDKKFHARCINLIGNSYFYLKDYKSAALAYHYGLKWDTANKDGEANLKYIRLVLGTDKAKPLNRSLVKLSCACKEVRQQISGGTFKVRASLKNETNEEVKNVVGICYFFYDKEHLPIPPAVITIETLKAGENREIEFVSGFPKGAKMYYGKDCQYRFSLYYGKMIFSDVTGKEFRSE